jgi:hypothetical protein
MSDVITDPSEIFEPSAVKNTDIASLAEEMDRTIYEMAYSESAKVSTLAQFDYERLVDYAAKTRAGVDKIRGTPRADWPFSYDRMYTIKYLTTEIVDDQVTNPALRWVIRWNSGMIANCTRSESAALSNGLLINDYNRLILGLNKLDAYIAGYSVEDDQADRPQSSPFQLSDNLTGTPA